MQQTIKIPTSDNHIIHGTLDFHKEKPEKLIIFVHGLSGEQVEHFFYNAANIFPTHGFATLRFDLYSGEEKGRQLENCTISTHIQDLDIVIKSTLAEYKDIYLVGHSLAGPIILQSTKLNHITKIILWDPTLDVPLMRNRYKYHSKMNLYYKVSNFYKFISKEMYEKFATTNTIELIKECQTPLKVILAEKSWGKLGDKVSNNSQSFKKTIIPNASHNFDEEGVEKLLFEETLEFILKENK